MVNTDDLPFTGFGFTVRGVLLFPVRECRVYSARATTTIRVNRAALIPQRCRVKSRVNVVD